MATDDSKPMRAPRVITNSPQLQSAFDSYTDFLDALSERAGVERPLSERIRGGHGIQVTESGENIVISEQRDISQKFFPFRLKLIHGSSTDSVRADPGLLFGGQSEAVSLAPYWPGFHGANAAGPAATDFELTAAGEFEFWGKVTVACETPEDVGDLLRMPNVVEFDVEKFDGVYTEGIHDTAGEIGNIRANVPDDDWETGVFYFFIGSAKKTATALKVHNVTRDHVYWWMGCNPNAGTANPGGYTPPFHPILTAGANTTSFEPGIVLATQEPSVAAQDPDVMWQDWEPLVSGLPMDDAGGLLAYAPGQVNEYWMKLEYNESEVTFLGYDPPQSGSPIGSGIYLVTDHQNGGSPTALDELGGYPVCLYYRMEDTPNIVGPFARPADGLTVKYQPVAKIDATVNPPKLTSYPHGLMYANRNWILGFRITSESYTPI